MAVVHWIQTIGEAASGVSEELRERHPQVPWRQIVDMRNPSWLTGIAMSTRQSFGKSSSAIYPRLMPRSARSSIRSIDAGVPPVPNELCRTGLACAELRSMGRPWRANWKHRWRTKWHRCELPDLITRRS